MHAVLESVVHRFSSALEGVDADTSQKHPQGKEHLWGIQQVVEHLVLTYRVTAKELEIRLAKGRVCRHQKRSGVQWPLQLMVLSFGYIPRGTPAMANTIPSPELFRPMDGEELYRLLREEMTAMDGLFDSCRSKFGMERIAVHPILGPLRVDQWRRYHAVHTLHHLEQILRIRQDVAPAVLQGRVFNVALGKELQIPAQRSLS